MNLNIEELQEKRSSILRGFRAVKALFVAGQIEQEVLDAYEAAVQELLPVIDREIKKLTV
jgi:hypothetical protein